MGSARSRHLLLLALAGSFVVADLASGQPAPPPAGARELGQPLAVPQGVPIQVLDVVATGAGVAATLRNVSSQRIVAYEATLLQPGDDGPHRLYATTSGTGLGWEPGVESVVQLMSQPLPEGARVVPMAAILADGSGFGDPAAVERFRREWRQRRDGLTGVLAVLDITAAPGSEDELAALIEHLALAMARVPGGRGSDVEQPYMETVAALKRLQGRGMVGSERFARELHGITSRLQRELDERSRFPALLETHH